MMKDGIAFSRPALILALLVFLAAPSAGSALRDEMCFAGGGRGIIDWEEGCIYGTAEGGVDETGSKNEIQAEIMAETAARYMAYRAVLDTARCIRQTSISDDAMDVATNFSGVTETSGVIRHAQVVDRKITWTEERPRAEVTVRVSMIDVISASTGNCFAVPETGETALSGPLPAVEKKTPSVHHNPAGPYTGLILDARGSGGKPALAPRILTDNGNTLVFGWNGKDEAVCPASGLIGYADTLEKAGADPRVGARPLVVTAEKASGRVNPCDFIVSVSTARRVVNADMRSPILKYSHIVIVLP